MNDDKLIIIYNIMNNFMMNGEIIKKYNLKKNYN